MAKKFYIGIDPGTKTGICVWDSKEAKIYLVQTLKIHQAMKTVEQWVKEYGREIAIWVEDARQARYGRSKDSHKAQGAGSVKRDCSIWEDFLEDLRVEYRMVRPDKSLTKLSPSVFKGMTGYGMRLSSHARDAAMLVFGM